MLSALRSLEPVFFSYVLSFIHIGIYWNNHHHMLHVTQQVSGAILRAKPSPALLALALSLRDRMDGGKPLRTGVDSPLWCGPVHGCGTL